jgi:polyadenylate-binding protein
MSNPTATGVQVPASGNPSFQQSQPPVPSGGTTANLPSGHASLYVGDLDDNVTEAMIYDKFSPIGSISSIRVCRDMITRKSLGYAYVNFSSPAEAEKAIDALNFDVLNNRQMRIMWSQRDPSLRKSGVGNLFIKNLDKDIVVRDLYDTFSTIGNILSCKITTDEKGVSKGYGFVHFASKEAAETAIKKLHGMSLKGKTVYVAHFVPKSQRSTQGSGDPQFNNVFIKNFGEDMTDEKLKEIFAEFGEITSHIVMKNDDGSSRGFGFVCFKEPGQAQQAVQLKNGSDYNGRTLYVGRAIKKADRMEQLRSQFDRKKTDKSSRYAVGVNLYVKNLDDSIDDDALRKEFAQHGNITSVKVMRDQYGRSKGFGFVCFTYPDEATKAVTEMNGKLVGGKPLYVALAQRKEERHAHLQTQIAHRQLGLRGAIPSSFQAATLISGGMNHVFQNPQMGPSLGMYNPFTGPPMTGAHNPNMNPGSRFYPPFNSGAMYSNLGMQPRQPLPRWGNVNPANAPAPGAPQPGIRPPGNMVGFPQSMMRPMTLPQTGLQQRFMGPPPSGQGNFPGQAQQPPSGAPRGTSIAASQSTAVMQMSMNSQVGPANQPRMSGPTPNVGNASGLSGQVQYAMTARNIQPSTQQQAAPVNPSTGGTPANRGPPSQPVAQAPPGVDGVSLELLPMEKFVALVQNADPAGQKQFLGEKLYSIIKQWHPDAVGKLTGMLLEIDNRELLGMIMDHRDDMPASTLRKKVDSALQVLENSKHLPKDSLDHPKGGE